MKYFYGDKSLNADIERHRKEEIKLREKIKELESIENPSNFDVRALRVTRHFLNQLLQSKADITSKIGKK